VLWRDETLGAEFDVVEIPADLLDQAKLYREQMIEAVSEFDDKLFEKFVEGAPLTVPEIKAGIRKATIAMNIPVIKLLKHPTVQSLAVALDGLPDVAGSAHDATTGGAERLHRLKAVAAHRKRILPQQR